jgi:sensor histidine kinase YesM
MLLSIRKHWRLLLVAGGGWLLVVVTTAFNYHFFRDVYGSLKDEPSGLKGLLEVETVYWAVWLLFVPPVLWLTAKVPFRRDRLARSVGVHLPACALACLAHRALYLFLFWLLFLVPVNTPARSAHIVKNLYQDLLFFNLPTGFLAYGTLMLVAQVLSSYRRLRDEELKASRLKAELAEAQLAALKLQLQPHFLFNTLHSISALLDSDVEAADRMLTRLGDFLRLTLDSSGVRDVTLARELRFVNGYLEIEKVRFPDRLRVEIDVEPSALSACVPNLILQPIVENAIKHGIARRLAPGRIVLRAQREGPTLRIQISDDGPGIAPAPGVKEGVGLGNTRARLRHQYGDAQRLALRNLPGGGLQVELEIPFAEQDELPRRPEAVSS